MREDSIESLKAVEELLLCAVDDLLGFMKGRMEAYLTREVKVVITPQALASLQGIVDFMVDRQQIRTIQLLQVFQSITAVEL